MRYYFLTVAVIYKGLKIDVIVLLVSPFLTVTSLSCLKF